jgi:hypothetical protein
VKHEPNPKKLMGDKKPPLHLLPLAGMIHQSLAHLDGDNKYGFENWNDKPVEKLTYLGALLRHAELYKYGESYSRDTNVHNLGAVMACCAILIDAEVNGNLIDNTKHSKATCDLMHQMEATVMALNNMQRERDAAKEQERKDQSWADAANEDADGRSPFNAAQWRADKFTTLHTDAMARMYGKNTAGSDRRETTDEPLRTCRDCKCWSACSRMGQCIGAEATHD